MGKEIFAVYYRDKWDGTMYELPAAFIPKETIVNGIKTPTATMTPNGLYYRLNEHGNKLVSSLVPYYNSRYVELFLKPVNADDIMDKLKSIIKKNEILITQIHNATV